MAELACPFRADVRLEDGNEVATCGLVQRLLQTTDDRNARVTRSACEACVESIPDSSAFVDDVFPSILFQACEGYLAEASTDSEQRTRVEQLKTVAEETIVGRQHQSQKLHACCDAFLPCPDASATTRASIESLLNQQDATVIVHLIVQNSDAESLAAEYSERWNVQLHRYQQTANPFDAIHQLVLKAKSEFLAFQHPAARSLPHRISNSINELRLSGADLAGSSMKAANGDVAAKLPHDEYARSIPWPTIVCRRSTFVDAGGMAQRETDPMDEFVFRIHQTGFVVGLLEENTVEISESWKPAPLGPRPNYSLQHGSLRHHAIGYPQRNVDCDVVLPVYGQLEYVAPAIESIIEQEGAEAIVHMVDDCGPDDATDLFRHWRSHPRVRQYRNTKNLGQYASFNNASEYFETELVAVQDGDDISLPHRLHTSGNLLRLCDADFFGATMELFGDNDIISNIFRGQQHHVSRFPSGDRKAYFVMNPTACFRVDMFRRLGGYTDYGATKFNRGGLDSEFMSRALHSGVRFAFSSSVVSLHRMHMESATRNSETGFGTTTRQRARNEAFRRAQIYQSSRTDPRVFGGIGRYAGITQRMS